MGKCERNKPCYTLDTDLSAVDWWIVLSIFQRTQTWTITGILLIEDCSMSLEIKYIIEFDCQIIFVEFSCRTQSTSMRRLSAIEIKFSWVRLTMPRLE